MKTDAFCEEQARIEFNRAPVNVSGLFEIALHTAAPQGNDQRSNEVDLDGYARVAVMRDIHQWAVRGRKTVNNNTISFPTIRKGKAKVTHVSIGIEGKVRRHIEIKEPFVLAAHHRVEFEPGEIEIVEDAK